MEDPNMTEELCAARAEELFEQVKAVLENEDWRVVGTTLSALLLMFIRHNLGEAAFSRLQSALAEIFGVSALDAARPDTRWINTLVAKGYDWPAKIGKAKKVGK